MEPDAATANMLALMAGSGLPALSELAPAAARAQNDPLSEAAEHRPEDVERVEDRVIESAETDIPVRIYWPQGHSAAAPVLVFYHGGGVIGSIDTHDSVCRTLANESRSITISVGYRLGPEHRFPAGLTDARTAFEWAARNAETVGGDPDRIAVGGDSCGGGIAAAVAQLQRAADTNAVCQLLVYPALDADRNATLYPSYAENASGYFLDRPLIDWFQSHYLEAGQDLRNPSVSPARNPDLSGLPPAVIVTAGLDPLRDEAAGYATRLRDAGVPVEYRCFESTIHGFVSMGRYIPLAMEALRYCARALEKATSA